MKHVPDLARLAVVPAGTCSGTGRLIHRPASGATGLGYWLAMPARIDHSRPLLVAVHGISRDARAQAELFAPRANALGQVVVAPEFGEKHWKRYQKAVIGQRSDVALLGLLDELRATGIWHGRRIELAGYSGGAQFAHRFAMLYPHLLARLSVVSAGWYTFPDEAPFPYGLGEAEGAASGWGAMAAAHLDRFLGLPIQICVGAKDNRRDRNTRRGPEIDAQQGRDRVARATAWSAALIAAARKRGIRPDITLRILPDCGHDFGDCVTRGGLDRIVLTGAQSES